MFSAPCSMFSAPEHKEGTGRECLLRNRRCCFLSCQMCLARVPSGDAAGERRRAASLKVAGHLQKQASLVAVLCTYWANLHLSLQVYWHLDLQVSTRPGSLRSCALPLWGVGPHPEQVAFLQSNQGLCLTWEFLVVRKKEPICKQSTFTCELESPPPPQWNRL